MLFTKYINHHLVLKFFLNYFRLSFQKNNETSNLSDEEKLCNSIQNMGRAL